jgi:prepilin-type N-terminal cleavage/methylation domain-containing protein/prepilin-type processing-associated H-X9-DG protein
MLEHKMRNSSTALRGSVSRGFTLIELLVVIVIIVALVAILIPALSAARERAKAALCMSNMKEMGVIIFEFAASHDDRGPGEYCQIQPTQADVAWWQVLNAEVLGRGKINFSASADNPATPYGISDGHGKISPPSGKSLGCPDFIRAFAPNGGGDIYNVPFAVNYDLIGGINFGTAPKWGLVGTDADVSMGANNDWAYYRYSLGAKVTRFHTNQMMIIESEGGDPGVTAAPFCGTVGYPSGAGKVAVGLQSGPPNYYPAYSGGAADPGIYNGAGNASFRHPYGKRGNFLFFDGHVDSMTPKDDILSPRRLGMPL